ncbi:GtrA family protein [Chitinophagaceae bacterium MMS25-I14]
MITFLKAQASSLIATLADFLICILLKELAGAWYLAATATGTIAGGVVNFIINKKWVFSPEDDNTTAQIIKYFLVWGGNFILNIAGVYLLTNYCGLHYIASKVLTATAVGFCYNYVLQKKFVFR